VLFNEPKLLKSAVPVPPRRCVLRFSALQRAEIAEIYLERLCCYRVTPSFSALQRAEIAEIQTVVWRRLVDGAVSVLFNEPKLLK